MKSGLELSTWPGVLPSRLWEGEEPYEMTEVFSFSCHFATYDPSYFLPHMQTRGLLCSLFIQQSYHWMHQTVHVRRKFSKSCHISKFPVVQIKLFSNHSQFKPRLFSQAKTTWQFWQKSGIVNCPTTYENLIKGKKNLYILKHYKKAAHSLR